MTDIHNKALLLCEQAESLAMAIAREEDEPEKRSMALVTAATGLIEKLEARSECPLCKRAHAKHDLDCAVGLLKEALQ